MMKQEDLLKKTGAILNELQEQYEFMLQDPQQISELELELFLANANFLTEHVQILRKISNYHPVKALPEHAAPSKLDESNAAPTKVFDDFFTPDKETPTFEFIVNDRTVSPHFVAESTSQVIEPASPEEEPEYPEKELYEIGEPEEDYDAPVEEPLVQRFEERAEDPLPLNRNVHPVYSNMDISSIPPEQIADDGPVGDDLNSLEQFEEEDEVGPEPFLVTATPEPVPEPARTPEPAPTPVVAAVPEPIIPVFTAPKVEPVQEPQRETFSPKYTEYTEPVRPAQPAAQTHQPTLNELLAAGKLGATKTPEPEASKPPIADLRRAISLNEKLLFVKDLFDGYNLAYAEAIDLVNKMPDFNTADQFLQKHYATKHNWASKKSTADQFYDLLRQRFPK